MEQDNLKPEEETPSYLDEVKAEREKMEALVLEMRELKAKSIMAGEADAGQPTEEKEKEETPQDYAAKALAGDISNE